MGRPNVFEVGDDLGRELGGEREAGVGGGEVEGASCGIVGLVGAGCEEPLGRGGVSGDFSLGDELGAEGDGVRWIVVFDVEREEGGCDLGQEGELFGDGVAVGFEVGDGVLVEGVVEACGGGAFMVFLVKGVAGEGVDGWGGWVNGDGVDDVFAVSEG